MAHDSAGRRVSGILANGADLNCHSEVICLQNRIVRGMEGVYIGRGRILKLMHCNRRIVPEIPLLMSAVDLIGHGVKELLRKQD